MNPLCNRKARWALLTVIAATLCCSTIALGNAPEDAEPPAPRVEAVTEIGQEALPASQRDPIPYVDPAALPFAVQHPILFDAFPYPRPSVEDDTVPSITMRSPEPIDPPPLDELRIVLDWYLSPQHAALLIAQARGDFERHGLTVAFNAPADPGLPPKLLAAARADLAIGRQAQLHMLVDQQLPLVRVASLIPSPLSSLVVAADSDIATLADLADKRVGYAVEDSLTPMLSGMLAQYDLGLDDLQLEYVNFSPALTLLEGRVDALIAPLRQVLPHHLEEEGLRVRSFAAEAHGIPRHDGLILMANRDTLASQRSEIKRLLIALEDATEWAVNHPEAAWELITNNHPTLDNAINQRAWPDTLRRLALRPSALDTRRYALLQNYLHDQGHIDTRQPLERLAVDLHAP
ncbi:putative hydroxymethylpyrimidine transport system substrate-binding protein [Franzmannia pantelleriensis]|uniref:Putative hydroxymethylpyrimidine transport system substrate-binding protein n=1 Tax=Franzmannia pantelleriensis TaxID=48727 RepID=A0A1G9FDK4_9GAMM|nr:ABC transporter substrate-binding protein [Halomonas pantelleriensis]SDK86426.1 putative hydroxymethylpyrimidine transport system substrate-binding protein [Halomonas pantelleriensis]